MLVHVGQWNAQPRPILPPQFWPMRPLGCVWVCCLGCGWNKNFGFHWGLHLGLPLGPGHLGSAWDLAGTTAGSSICWPPFVFHGELCVRSWTRAPYGYDVQMTGLSHFASKCTLIQSTCSELRLLPPASVFKDLCKIPFSACIYVPFFMILDHVDWHICFQAMVV